MFRRLATLIVGIGLATAAVPSTTAVAVSCATPLPQGGDTVELDPADFVDRIDNPFLPMPPGAVWTYRETEPEGSRQLVARDRHVPDPIDPRHRRRRGARQGDRTG